MDINIDTKNFKKSLTPLSVKKTFNFSIKPQFLNLRKKLMKKNSPSMKGKILTSILYKKQSHKTKLTDAKKTVGFTLRIVEFNKSCMNN